MFFPPLIENAKINLNLKYVISVLLYGRDVFLGGELKIKQAYEKIINLVLKSSQLDHRKLGYKWIAEEYVRKQN